MKKIFYFIASAIVALGAVACQNEGLDNIAPEANGDIVSFVANIDNTKTGLNEELKTVWTAGDAIMVTWNNNTYEFKNSEADVNTFTCQAGGLSAILDAEEITATYSENNDGMIDSTAGLKGALLSFEGSFAELENVGFQVQNAFLKFTTTGAAVKLKGDKLFVVDGEVVNGIVIEEAGDHYVAINPAENVTISYDIDGATIKSTTATFAARHIYNLGTLEAPAAPITIYLAPGIWSSDNAWFAALVGETWVKMTDSDFDGVYECEVPAGSTLVTFYRMDPGKTELAIASAWNNSGELTIDTENLCYTITGWNKGEGNWGEKPAAPTYAVAGDFNTWGDKVMTAVDDVDHLYVAKSVTMEAYKNFKVKIAGSWDTSWGASISYVQQNKFFTAILGGGDISIEKSGTYDVYFDRANLKIYLMTSGTNYTSATEQTANGTAPVEGNMYYFKPNSNWAQANAKFSGYFWNASGNKWAELVDSDSDGIYECNLGEWVPTSAIFLRKDPTGYVYNNWTCWNRIGNLTIPNGKNFYEMASGVWTQQMESGSGYTGGTWSTK